jgi:hypothetical protein
MLPSFVQVVGAANHYSVAYWAGTYWHQLTAGNQEQVHSWLGQQGYKRTNHAGLVFTGEYYREAGAHAA